MTVTPVEPAELAEAFALLYGPDAGEDIEHASRMVARGELNPKDVLVARCDGALVGAVVGSRLPGGTAVVWPPRAAGGDGGVEDSLTAAALGHVAGAKAVQALLPPEVAGRAEPLLRAGFRHVTRVWQMSLPLAANHGGEPSGVSRRVKSQAPDTLPAASRPAARLDPSRLTAIPYADCDPSTFHATLVRAHDDSLDCPELHGRLTPDEVLAGYRDSAPDPAGWWLAVADDRPAGVLLLNGDELTFLGAVPEWRGRGVGRRLLDLARARAPELTLIVDARNGPAYQLYRSAGLEVVGAREVFLYFPPPAAGIIDPKVRRS